MHRWCPLVCLARRDRLGLWLCARLLWQRSFSRCLYLLRHGDDIFDVVFTFVGYIRWPKCARSKGFGLYPLSILSRFLPTDFGFQLKERGYIVAACSRGRVRWQTEAKSCLPLLAFCRGCAWTADGVQSGRRSVCECRPVGFAGGRHFVSRVLLNVA